MLIIIITFSTSFLTSLALGLQDGITLCGPKYIQRPTLN